MGGFRNKNKKKKQQQQNADGTAPPKDATVEKKPRNNPDQLMGYVKVQKMENETFEKYYKWQGICEDEADYTEFMRMIKTGLPCGVRVNGIQGGHAAEVLKQFTGLLDLPDAPEGTVIADVVKSNPNLNSNGNANGNAHADGEKDTTTCTKTIANGVEKIELTPEEKNRCSKSKFLHSQTNNARMVSKRLSHAI